jgi:hypothetical protein
MLVSTVPWACPSRVESSPDSEELLFTVHVERESLPSRRQVTLKELFSVQAFPLGFLPEPGPQYGRHPRPDQQNSACAASRAEWFSRSVRCVCDGGY